MFQKKSITILTNHNNKAMEYLGNKLKNLMGISLTYYSFFCVSFSTFNESNIFFLKPILFLLSLTIINIFKEIYDVIIGQCGNYGKK